MRAHSAQGNLTGANLTGANLTGANLTQARQAKSRARERPRVPRNSTQS
ncbi:MAG: pentapeptide repeat-containing protein [Roseinatronobacter sp.]